MLQERTASLKSVVRSLEYAVISQRRVAYGVLSALWTRSSPIAVGLVAALALASIALILVGPRYTSRAMIQFKFVREEPANTSKIATTAAVDAMAVLNDAAPMIRSHAIAGAVVTRLGLDKDPAFARGSRLWRVFSEIRSLLGYQVSGPSSRDLAEEQLIRRIKVTADPRSYLVSISVTASDPEWAAKLANAVALEYLRGQLLQQVSDSYAAAERELSDLSSVYGVRHPAYQSVHTRLEVLRHQLTELRDEPFDESVASRVTGQSFVAAQKVLVPSGPNILLVLGLTAAGTLGIGAWLALQPWPNGLARIGWLSKLRLSLPVFAGWFNVSPQPDGFVASEPAVGAKEHDDRSGARHQESID